MHIYFFMTFEIRSNHIGIQGIHTGIQFQENTLKNLGTFDTEQSLKSQIILFFILSNITLNAGILYFGLFTQTTKHSGI